MIGTWRKWNARRVLRGGRRPDRWAPGVEQLEARNLLSFLPQVPFPAGSEPLAVTVADLTGSGVQDLITANVQGDSVSVLLGNGDGTFGPPHDYPAGQAPWSVAVADFNGDGIPDLAVADLLPYPTGTVSVLLGNGDGTFQKAVAYPVGSNPRSVVAADFNGDGIPDLAVDNTASQTISVLLGNGDGTFQPAHDYPVGFSFALAVGDVNGDGTPDLVAANATANNVSVLLGNGDGTFQSAVNYPVGPYPFSVAIADVNNDGFPDLITANANGNNVSVLLGNGDGTFQPAVNYGVGVYPLSVAVGDFNNDGNVDLAVADSALTGGTSAVSVLLGNGDGTFQPALNYPVSGHPYHVAVGDFNGDGFADLATANSITDNVSVLLNAADWGPAPGAAGLRPASNLLQGGTQPERAPSPNSRVTDATVTQGALVNSRPTEAPGMRPAPAHADHLFAAGLVADDRWALAAWQFDGWWGASDPSAVMRPSTCVSGRYRT
jgi:hypothetical protein